MNEEEFRQETDVQPEEAQDESLIGQEDLDAAQAEAEAAQQQAEQATGDERVDWKARAIEAQTRLEMMQQQAQQHQQPQEQQVDEVTYLQQQIQEKRASMPALDDKNPQTFWDRERVKDEIDGLQDQLVEARMRQQERFIMEQRVGGVVQQYKAQQQNNPYFRQVEQQFDQMVSRLEPHLKGNVTMLDMIRKNLEHDQLMKQQNQRKAPPQPPSGAFQPQAGAKPNQGKVQWRSEEDRRVGEYYVQRGIISGPEEFYDQRYNEKSESANNNGVAIYDVPAGPRGWRR